jgi:hypothetical protein
MDLTVAGPKQIGEIVNHHSALQTLVTRATELKRLHSVFAARLGDGFANNFDVANIRDDGTLVLFASSPAWATRLRYVVPDLLRWARDIPALEKVSNIQVQVSRAVTPR